MIKRWRYFKVGDTVVNPAIWGNRKFVIDKMYGNDYCPILDVHFACENKTNGNTCLLNPYTTRLVNSNKRPLSKLGKEKVIQMMKRGIEEAKREFLIRTYNNIK